MIDHILVPLDGSSTAECVLPHVVAMAQALDARVTLLRVVERGRTNVQSRAVDPLQWHIRKSEADAYLDEWVISLREVGLRAEKSLLEGRAAERIVEFAHDQDVGLIVISSHGQSGLSRWNISSVVQKVLLRAYVPAMIVKAYRRVTDDLTGVGYERLLIPLDGSQRAECVLPLATALAGFHECMLRLVHVVSRPEIPRRMPLTEEATELIEQVVAYNREEGTRYLEELKSRLPLDVQTQVLVRDNTAASLHQLVVREDIDLVLLSAHGYSGEARWPYGSIALNFIAYGTMPLLIVQDLSREEMGSTLAEIAARESWGH